MPILTLDIIEKESYQIIREDEQVFDDVLELVEELPDNSPRYIVLSYPYQADGRLKTPLVLLYWIPPTSGSESRMLYAGALEQFREKAGVSKVLKFEEEEDFEDLQQQLE